MTVTSMDYHDTDNAFLNHAHQEEHSCLMRHYYDVIGFRTSMIETF